MLLKVTNEAEIEYGYDRISRGEFVSRWRRSKTNSYRLGKEVYQRLCAFGTCLDSGCNRLYSIATQDEVPASRMEDTFPILQCSETSHLVDHYHMNRKCTHLQAVPHRSFPSTCLWFLESAPFSYSALSYFK
jgi:hypothetical protein